MNFNIYLRKDIVEKVTKSTENFHQSRHFIISEALEEWLDRHYFSTWPKDFFDFEPLKSVPDFKKLLKELKDISEDPN